MRPILIGPLACACAANEAAASVAASARGTRRVVGIGGSEVSVRRMVEDEAAGLARENLGLVAMWGVSAIRDHEQAGFRQSTLDRVDLRQRPVFVAFALDGEHRAI